MCLNPPGSLCTGAPELQPHPGLDTLNLTHADKWLLSPPFRGCKAETNSISGEKQTRVGGSHGIC